MDIIKVKANSRTAAVAGAIAGVMRENKHAEVQAIGAGAVNQSVKAIILAKGYLAEDGMSIYCIPSFVEVDIEGNIRTAVKLSIDIFKEAEEDVSYIPQTSEENDDVVVEDGEIS
ncbi:MAG: stage V sporulation protein S [Anaerolineaceae bacterium]|nr:stage V sporulation protein S [Anaerolineaceae bacterium]